MILQNTEQRFFDRYDDFQEIYEAFPGMSIDLLIYTPDELNNIMPRPFIHDILTRGGVLHER